MARAALAVLNRRQQHGGLALFPTTTNNGCNPECGMEGSARRKRSPPCMVEKMLGFTRAQQLHSWRSCNGRQHAAVRCPTRRPGDFFFVPRSISRLIKP